MLNEIVKPGDFLLAAPALAGSYFQDSIIFITECSSRSGCWGLVINQPVHMPLDEVFKRTVRATNRSIPWDMEGLSRHLHTFFFGGPVQNTDPFQKLSVCVIEAQASVFTDAHEVSKGVFLSRVPLDMELPVSALIAPQNKTARMFFGYSGWGAGQLENEILNGAWEVSNPVPYEVFSKKRDEVPTTVNSFREIYERSYRAR
ncbi:MAG: YqgE/AlgH family protein [Fibromonadales bacterium]|nr:YqgE/AlgH family protein [Fibromonadales bacterium]